MRLVKPLLITLVHVLRAPSWAAISAPCEAGAGRLQSRCDACCRSSAALAAAETPALMTGLRQLLFGDAPLKAMVTLGMKYGAGDLIAQQATTPGGELNCARAAVFGAFGTYYGFVNYSVFRLLAWSPVPAGTWPKAAFSAFFDGCIHVPILLYPQLLRPAQMASRQRQDWPLTARARAQSLGPLCPQRSPGSAAQERVRTVHDADSTVPAHPGCIW